jgi:GT2 family glycosyltransferase
MRGNFVVQSLKQLAELDEIKQQRVVLKPSVSIVIVHHKGNELLCKCLQSVFRTNYSNYQVVLVDNGSKDGSVNATKMIFGNRLSLIRSDVNLGFVGGNNLALQRIQGEYVVLLNDDTVVSPDWLQQLISVEESDSLVGACQPKLLSLTDPKYFEYNGCAGGMMDVYGVPFCRGRVFDVIERDEGQYDHLAEVFWAGGAAILIRRSVLDRTGLLDSLFYAHMEEIDLCWRIRLMGYKILAVPSAVVYHLGGGTGISEKFYLKQRNNLIMMIKNYSLSSLVRYFPGRLVLDALSFCYFLAKHENIRALSILKAYLSLMQRFKQVVERRNMVQLTRRVRDGSILKAMFRRSVAIQHYLTGRKSFAQLADS